MLDQAREMLILEALGQWRITKDWHASPMWISIWLATNFLTKRKMFDWVPRQRWDYPLCPGPSLSQPNLALHCQYWHLYTYAGSILREDPSISVYVTSAPTPLGSLQNGKIVTERSSRLQWMRAAALNKCRMKHSSLDRRAEHKVNGHMSFGGWTKMKLLCIIALLL